MFFSIGGAATATMVTAVLPSVSTRKEQDREPKIDRQQAYGVTHPSSASAASSEATVTPARLAQESDRKKWDWRSLLSGSRLSGFVGAFTGLGALLALGIFLPLPSQFQNLGISAKTSLRDAYYVVGAIALVVGIWCLAGLRGLQGEEHKSIYALWQPNQSGLGGSDEIEPYWKLFFGSLKAARHYPDILLGYVGGFVARASSVGLSLFIPLFVNNYFISSGLCGLDDDTQVESQCREAYVVAAKLTGVSQLVALLLAPAFGFFPNKFHFYHVPLLFASTSGLFGYAALAFFIGTPDPSKAGGSNWIYLIVSLLGIGQIGAIVCSLGLLSDTISASASAEAADLHENHRGLDSENSATESHAITGEWTGGVFGESRPLLCQQYREKPDLSRLKGSIAGTYSFAGGAGILLL